jgi:hypothetical protein
MKQLLAILLIVSTILCSCSKEPENIVTRLPDISGKIPAGSPPTDSINNPPASIPEPGEKSILIDASKDGGVWWFPQGNNGFYASLPHQGKALADYFKFRGYRVDEIPRGTVITAELLNKYTNVVRAGGFGSYSSAELAAYESFLSRSSSLLLLQDHLTNFPNDALSIRLGLHFEGVQFGVLGTITPHPVTQSTHTIPFNAGSFIRDYDPAIVTPLGFVNGNVVMGERKHPTSRIFFISDINGIESVPQPFVSDLMRWLFR